MTPVLVSGIPILFTFLSSDYYSDIIATFYNGDFRANTGKGFTRADLVMRLEMLKVLDEFYDELIY